MAHSNIPQSPYDNSMYAASPQQTSRIMSHQQAGSHLYFDNYQPYGPASHLPLRLSSSPLPKIECPSPSSQGSPSMMQSVNHSPEHHLSASHIVSLGNSSPGNINNKHILDGHLDRPTVVSISS